MITVGNVSVNFLIPLLLVAAVGVPASHKARLAVWTGDIVAILAVEIAAWRVIALGLGLYVRSRRTDFV